MRAQRFRGCSGPVALEGEDVLAGPEDLLDPLAYGREVRAAVRARLCVGADDRGSERSRLRELAPA